MTSPSLSDSPNLDAAARREMVVFLVVAMFASWSVMIPIVRGLPADFRPGDVEAVKQAFGNWLMLFGVGPMFAAIAVTAWYRGTAGVAALFKCIVPRGVGAGWYAVALLLPLVPQWIGLWAWGIWTGHTVTYPPFASFMFSWLQIAAISTLYFITEELGWRGYLLPRALARSHWLVAALWVGIAWAIWHYPYWLTASWAATGDLSGAIVSTGASTFRAVALSVMLTWIFRHTRGCVLFAMLFHGAGNANFDKMFAAAGSAAEQGSTFLVIQGAAAVAIALLLVVGLKVFMARAQEPSSGVVR